MSNINFKIDSEIKHQAEQVFAGLGMNTTQALNMFLRQVIYEQGIPFQLKLPKQPNRETLRAMQDVEDDNVENADNMDDLFASLKS